MGHWSASLVLTWRQHTTVVSFRTADVRAECIQKKQFCWNSIVSACNTWFVSVSACVFLHCICACQCFWFCPLLVVNVRLSRLLYDFHTVWGSHVDDSVVVCSPCVVLLSPVVTFAICFFLFSACLFPYFYWVLGPSVCVCVHSLLLVPLGGFPVTILFWMNHYVVVCVHTLKQTDNTVG